MKIDTHNFRRLIAWTLALLVVPAVLTVVFVLVMQEFRRSDALWAQVEASYEARSTLDALLSLHQDIELGQRGYILAEDEAFLAPYLGARERIAPAFEKVDALLGPSAQMNQLHVASEAKLAFVENTLALTRQGDASQARDMIRSGRGKQLMDVIRNLIADLEYAQAVQLQDRIDDSRAARRNVEIAVFAIFVALSALLVLAILLTSRSMRLRGEAARKFRNLSARQVAILEGARDGILTVNTSGSIESLNSAAAAMTGYSAEDLVRRDIGVLFEIAPDQGHKESFLRRFVRSTQDHGQVIPLWGKRKNGTLFPCDVVISPAMLDNRTIFVAIVRDTTERRRVEQMKSEFVSTVSHELRTPLTSIAGSLGLVSGGAAGEVPAKAARLIDIARSNCDRLVRLINDILDIEKLESGRMEIALQPVPLAAFLEQALQANLGYAEQYDVALELEPVDPQATVFADPDLLMQVMANLLSNAAKFSSAGDIVTIRTAPLDRRWRIDVVDRGAGIPAEFQARIFGKFAQAEATDSRQKGGTGLGLSIVREIVNRMGGQVTFHSEPGAGTTFHVDLPDHDRGERLRQSSHSSLRVLHVEDDPDVLELVAEALGDRYTLQSVQTLEEARRIMKDAAFDVVILDFALPDGSGKELIPLLRARGTQILVFTAQDADVEVARQVDALLIKSRSSLAGLVETIDRLLEQRADALEGRP